MATQNSVNVGLSGASGTGSFAGTTSATLVTPILGTPQSGTLTSCTGLPIAGITGLGTGVATALAANVSGSGGIALDTDSTFTPVLNFGGATTGITYSIQAGAYTRVGKILTIVLNINLSSKGSATGAATITGLPVSARGSITSAVISMLQENFTFTTQPVPVILTGQSQISLFIPVTTTSLSAITDTSFSNTSKIYITGTYLV